MRKVIGPVEVYVVEEDATSGRGPSRTALWEGEQPSCTVVLRSPGPPELQWVLQNGWIRLSSGDMQSVIYRAEPCDGMLDP